MNRRMMKGANKRVAVRSLRLLLFCALLVLMFFSARNEIPLFIKLMVWYPIGVIGLWALLMRRRKEKGCGCSKRSDSLNPLKITIAHTIFLIIASVSFLMVNQVVSSWYVICDIFGTELEEKVTETIKCFGLFSIVILVIMIRSGLDYKKFGLEHFSITVHGLGLMGTLICYSSIIGSNQNIERYGDRIMSCEGVYIESLVLAILFLLFCDWMKKKNQNIYEQQF